MATNTDIQEYPSYDTKGKLVKSATLPGKEGKQIKIEAVSIQLYSGKKGVTNNTVVSVNGTPYAAWNYETAAYSDVLTYNKYPFIVDQGKDAIITVTEKTSDAKIVVKCKNFAYTFSYVDVATPTPADETKKSLVVIDCASTEKAEAVIKDIQEKGVLKEGMSVYIQKSV